MPRLLVMLMLLTVLGAQICGMQRGYLCEDHHTTEQSCPEHEEHAPLKEELQADQTVQIAVLAPLAVLTPILDFSAVLEKQTKRPISRENTHEPPLWPPRLTQSIALRI